jgi:hypothetical protein
MIDFTHQVYKQLLQTFLDNDFQFITVEEYFNSNYDNKKPFIMMRHDVDRRPNNSLNMAKLEYNLGVKATYYFRTTPQILKPNIIKEIVSLGHEIGYHYECLAETNGDYEKAIKDFEINLFKLNRLYPIKNIAMHGRPTSKWDSRLLWKKYDYREYNILSEPYFDIDFNKIFYTTDASRAWENETINLRDRVDTDFKFSFKHTEDIIEGLNEKILPTQIMINIHPEHWAIKTIEWYKILIIRKIKNFIKNMILKRKIL